MAVIARSIRSPSTTGDE